MLEPPKGGRAERVPGVDGVMTPFRTTLALGIALLALGVPSIASASTDPGAAKTNAAGLKSTATIHKLMTCLSKPSCQRTAALSLQRDVQASASGVLMHTAGSGCNLLPFERLYGPTQTALSTWAAKPSQARATRALLAIHTWYTAVGATSACAAA